MKNIIIKKSNKLEAGGFYEKINKRFCAGGDVGRTSSV